MSQVRPSWFAFAMTAPADRAAFDLLDALLWQPIGKMIATAEEGEDVKNAILKRNAVRDEFLAEADELGLEVGRFHYLRGRVEKARGAFLDHGGSFGHFTDGVFHEPVHPRVANKTSVGIDSFVDDQGQKMIRMTTPMVTSLEFMEDVIDRQTLLRLHVLSMLEAREAAREAKAAKDAAKAAEKAAKAAAKEAARVAAEEANT